MESTLSPSLFPSFRHVLWNVVLIALGSVLCAVAINGILIPQHFVAGGITGLALILHNRFPAFNTGFIYFLLNLPLFALAWVAVGRRFFFYSVAGSLFLSLAVAFIHVPIELDDRMLGALLAGIVTGAGVGVTLRSAGSQGGLDILSIILLRRYSVSIGSTVLVVNGLILVLVGFFYSLEALLYTAILLFVSSKVVNIVVTGLSQRKAVFIISSRWQEISQEILRDTRRGVTVIKGQGGYSGQQEHILYTVITFREISHFKRFIQQIDPKAFVVISDTLEVMNYRIGNQPHW